MAKSTGGIKIRKQSAESTARRVIGLAESSYVRKSDGKTRATLQLTVDDVPQRGTSHEWQWWNDVVSVMADGGLEAIREWCAAQRTADGK